MDHELGGRWARQPNPCCSLLILGLSCMCSLLVWFLLPIIPVTIKPTYCVVTVHHAACCWIYKKARQEPEGTAPFHPKRPQKNSHRWRGQDSNEPLFRKVLLQWPERSVLHPWTFYKTHFCSDDFNPHAPLQFLNSDGISLLVVQ